MEGEQVDQNIQRSLRDYAAPTVGGIQTGILQPAIQANNFEIKPALIQMVQANQFGGSSMDDPNDHVTNFLQICETFKNNGASSDAVRLRLFPFSLRDKARSWLNSLPPGSVTTWDQLAQKFLARFFPPARTAKLRNDITSFVQIEGESLYECWERFKELLRRCPHHGIPLWLQVQTFYNGLGGSLRNMIDAPSGDTLMTKTPNEAFDLIDGMAANSYSWQSERATPARVMGVYGADRIAELTAQVASLTDQLSKLNPSNSFSTNQVVCEWCAGPHASVECQAGNPFAQTSNCSSERVNYVNNFQQRPNQGPYSNTYNPGWRNHPNFSWKENNNTIRPPPGFQLQQEKKPNLEELLTTFIQKVETRFHNQEATMHNLEMQMSQLAQLTASRQQGALPSNTEKNPKEEVNAISLRSGKELRTPKAHNSNQVS